MQRGTSKLKHLLRLVLGTFAEPVDKVFSGTPSLKGRILAEPISNKIDEMLR